MKIDVHCHVQGDVVIECIHLDEDLVREEMIFRVMFHTAFVRSNILMLSRDEIDVLWDARDQFSKDFKAEVLYRSFLLCNVLFEATVFFKVCQLISLSGTLFGC